MQNLYDDAFFALHENESRTSARLIIPRVLDLVRPRSVIDIGCGTGTWLAEFAAAGISDYMGIDGEYVNRRKLLIPPDRFFPHDLQVAFGLNRTFDLAVCVEVAEHLPPESANGLVHSLTRLAPVVLFSAAIPGQTGHGHINESWPEYWQRFFRQQNFVAIDCLRMNLWNNPQISVWYKQNVLFYVDLAQIENYPRLAQYFAENGEQVVAPLVHPDHYQTSQRSIFTTAIQAPHEALSTVLGLRKINLLVQPDWNQDDEVLAKDLAALLEALWTHPQRANTAVVFHLPSDREMRSMQFLQRIINGAYSPGKTRPIDGPEYVAVGSDFGPKHFGLLMESSAARISLSQDDTNAIERTGSHRLAMITLSDIAQQRSFVAL